MFINRKAELDQLSYLYHSNRAELFILYDHRRVGKTELLRAFDGESYTGFNGTTDAHGQVTFTLPQATASAPTTTACPSGRGAGTGGTARPRWPRLKQLVAELHWTTMRKSEIAF